MTEPHGGVVRGREGAATEWIIENAQGPELTVGGRAITSFVSANYLSFEPPCSCGSPAFGTRQSLGVPASLARDADTAALERELAAWVDQPGAVLGKSAFHLLVDLLQTAAEEGPVLVSRDSYALTKLASRLLGRCPVVLFQSVQEARYILLSKLIHVGRPSLFVDGWSLRGAKPPLAELAYLAASHGGRLIVDDTQALGLLGGAVDGLVHGSPWGAGGNGTLPFAGVRSEHTVVVASLGKAFGLPLAFAAGPRALVRRLRRSAPLAHAASQPPLGLVRAARHALVWNRSAGDAARARLLRAVGQLRELVGTVGVACSPMQSWILPSLQQAKSLYRRLFERGIWVLLQRHGKRGGALTFLLTAAHEGPALARVGAKLESLMAPHRTEHPW